MIGNEFNIFLHNQGINQKKKENICNNAIHEA